MSNNFSTPPNPMDMRNLILAVIICSAVLFGWNFFYQQPRILAQQAAEKARVEQLAKSTAVSGDVIARGDVVLPGEKASIGQSVAASDEISSLPRERILASTPRVKVSSDALHGSINLAGLRFDDLTLARHRTTVEKDSPEVVLLSPAQTLNRYFLQVGWLAPQGESIRLPDRNSLWQADADMLTPATPVNLKWDNGQGVVFHVQVGLDEDYLFTLRQRIENNTGAAISVMPYALANHALPPGEHFANIVHQGPIGSLDDELVEVNYADLEKAGKETFAGVKGWVGSADKYWLTAFIPPQTEAFTTNYQFLTPQGNKRTQVDYLGTAQTIQPGQASDYTLHIFAGAKELDVLDRYSEQLNLPLFDRALDFGVLYFLTRPIFETLDYFFGLLGNFGLAILLLVVCLKLLLYPLSNKSYRSMAQMRALQPKIEAIRTEHGEDKARAQQEIMKLWQKEKVNPLSGCLPLLIQIPIFFALYKVLNVSIEMRHQPFYGWVHDLSAPDMTNIFTLFGLVEWPHPAILHLGAWPIIMAITMYFQQKMNPPPSDPIQAKVIGLLPWIFLVLFASFPAGLLIYWAWNNVLSIGQQYIINRSYEKHKVKKAASAVTLEGGAPAKKRK
ncbi:MAG: membrane protein insertase YidC [Alphaproteobacteria bacterium]|nr:membrane protein insertase YidC [Alphaproteobacteria bacterium]